MISHVNTGADKHNAMQINLKTLKTKDQNNFTLHYILRQRLHQTDFHPDKYTSHWEFQEESHKTFLKVNK